MPSLLLLPLGRRGALPGRQAALLVQGRAREDLQRTIETTRNLHVRLLLLRARPPGLRMSPGD